MNISDVHGLPVVYYRPDGSIVCFSCAIKLTITKKEHIISKRNNTFHCSLCMGSLTSLPKIEKVKPKDQVWTCAWDYPCVWRNKLGPEYCKNCKHLRVDGKPVPFERIV